MADFIPQNSGPTGYTMPPTQGPQKFSAKVFLLIPLLLLAWLGWSLIDFFQGDQIFPNNIRGAYVTSTYIPTGVNQGKTFLLTDGSFHFYYQNSSPGTTSSGTTSIFNKIYYGFYQPGQSTLTNRNIVNFTKETPTIESYWV